jgi:predicted DNA-binding protein (MmcQ/YjbR family)
MDVETVRRYCLLLPHATEGIQCRSRANSMAFKCTPENFADLTEREGIIPAPYMALPRAELKRLIRESYDMVAAKLPVRAELGLK